MRNIIKIAPIHSSVFLSDVDNYDIPEWPAGLSLASMRVASNDRCVIVRTLAEVDGETEIALTDRPDGRIAGCTQLIFDGVVKFPSGNVTITTSGNEVLLSAPCQKPEVRIRIWTTGDPDPDKITVEIVEGE